MHGTLIGHKLRCSNSVLGSEQKHVRNNQRSLNFCYDNHIWADLFFLNYLHFTVRSSQNDE